MLYEIQLALYKMNVKYHKMKNVLEESRQTHQSKQNFLAVAVLNDSERIFKFIKAKNKKMKEWERERRANIEITNYLETKRLETQQQQNQPTMGSMKLASTIGENLAPITALTNADARRATVRAKHDSNLLVASEVNQQPPSPLFGFQRDCQSSTSIRVARLKEKSKNSSAQLSESKREESIHGLETLKEE